MVPIPGNFAPTASKQDSALALPTKGQIARLLSAITRAFPYIGVEYVVFLALIEYNPMAAWVMGILAVVGGIGLAGLRAIRPASQPALAWEQMVVGWFGQVYCTAASVAAFGLGLLAWSRWHATNSAFFSGVSVVALIAALLLLVAASYLRQEA